MFFWLECCGRTFGTSDWFSRKLLNLCHWKKIPTLLIFNLFQLFVTKWRTCKAVRRKWPYCHVICETLEMEPQIWSRPLLSNSFHFIVHFYFILTLTSFYLLFASVEGYFCIWSNSRTHTHTLGRSPLDEGSARRRKTVSDSTQHFKKRDIHALGGIRTLNPKKRVTADPRLIPHNHRDRPNVHR